MKVTLINWTPDPLETLIFTKNTRLHLDGTGMEEIKAWPEAKKMEELEYMKGTIKSSWEFVQLMFVIEGVTRAFTHQLVRHRVGTSFAQQAQRVVDLADFEDIPGPSILANPEAQAFWDIAMDEIRSNYAELTRGLGVKRQDARGIVPTNVSTNIIFGANLRTLHEMARIRLCVKAQGEFQDVFRAMRAAVVEVMPWVEDMIQVECCVSGTCAFPTYPVDDCPVKPYVYDPRTARAYGGGSPRTLRVLRVIHGRERAEAQPEAPESEEKAPETGEANLTREEGQGPHPGGSPWERGEEVGL